MSDTGRDRSSSLSSMDMEEMKMRGQLVLGLCSLYTKHMGQKVEQKVVKLKDDTVGAILSQRPRSYSMGDVPPKAKSGNP